MPLRGVTRTVSPSSANRLRRSDSYRSVSSGSGLSDDSLPRSPANALNGGPKAKSVSFNNNVRVQYPRRTSHSFSKFDSLTSLNGRSSPTSNGLNEIDYSSTNANGGGIPYASSPHHSPAQPQTINQPSKAGGKKFWSNVWRSHSTRRHDDSSPVIKYKVKHNSPLLTRKIAGKKQAGSESPQVRRNHVKKIVNLFNRQAAVTKQKQKEDQETSGPKKSLHDLQSPTMPLVPSSTMPRSSAARSTSPTVRPSASPPAPPGQPKTSSTTKTLMQGPTTIKRTVTTTTYEPRPYEHVSFSNPLNLHSTSPHTDSSVNNSDKENSSFQSGSSFLNRDSGISLPASPIRSTSPGPFISTVTLNHSPKSARDTRAPTARNSRDFRHEFHSVPPFEDRGGHFGGQSSDDSLYSDSGPPQRPLRNKPSSALNIPPPPQMQPPPMKDVAIQVKPGNLTPVEELPARIYAPLYSQVNKALKKTNSSPPPPPPPPTSSMPPTRWSSQSALTTSSSPHRGGPLNPRDSLLGSSRDSRSQSPQWRHYGSGSPARYGDHSLSGAHLGYERSSMSSPQMHHSLPVSRYSDLEHGITPHSDFGLSDGESAASRSRTPQSHVKTSGRSFGFNIGTKKKVKSKKSKAAHESDSSSTSSQGVERSKSMLRATTAPKTLANPTGSRTQHYNSLLDLSPAYNRSAYPTYEDEYGPTPKPPHTYSWTLSLGRAPKSKRSVDGGSTATGPIYSSQPPLSQIPRKAYSDAPSSIDEEHPSHFGQGPRRGGLAAAFHQRNTRGEAFNSGASSCGSMTASEAAGIREPIVMYIPGVQRTRAPPDAAVNRSNSFLQQQTTPDRNNSPHNYHPGPQQPQGSSATLGRKEHKSRFAKQEAKSSRNERYKKDAEREMDRHTAVQRSKSIPRNARFL